MDHDNRIVHSQTYRAIVTFIFLEYLTFIAIVFSEITKHLKKKNF